MARAHPSATGVKKRALIGLLCALKARAYRFVTITPASHDRVLKRSGFRIAHSLEDVLGWSMPFEPDTLDLELLELLRDAEAVREDAGFLRSMIRISSLGDALFVHSAHPTDAEDAVFFGPDSYRFANLIKAELSECTGTIVDIGTGSGVGAMVAARRCPEARIVMVDINRRALEFAEVNATAAGVSAEYVLGDSLDPIGGPIEVALANPPYIIDTTNRTYRDGGELLGGQVSLDMARMAVDRLSPGGKLILYTGTAIVDGHDALHDALEQLPCDLRYREIDPDVFGEELASPAYGSVDRIAVVAAILTK